MDSIQPCASLALAQRAVLGECLQWHGPSQRWWWTDIEAARLHAWTPGSEATLNCALPDRMGCFAHTRSGGLIAGLALGLSLGRLDDLQAVGAADIALQPLVTVESDEPRTRINDGRCDRRGQLVFGTMHEGPQREAIGSFYQYSLRHGLRRLALPTVAIANSICFSPDGGTLYFCDTQSRLIQHCDYDADSASVSHIRPFARMVDPGAWPDGSVIDVEGCLWNAQWGVGRIARYAPDGRLLQSVSVPVAHTSCPALGGERGDQLMVTTARQELSPAQLAAMPLSGSLFGLRLAQDLALADELFDDSPQEETSK